ncbi:MAG: hypothetical protein IJG31_05705 [Fusobacterium sp.]|nr:hypothetical protein [Fusobacterium sp.]
MKKIIMILMIIIVLVGCTNQKVVQYNTDRLDHIEEYLRENKTVKAGEIDKLVEDKTIEYNEEFKSLEKEAEAWLENQQQK